MNELNTKLEVISEIKLLTISCPECGSFYLDDEQYTCTTCWCTGGGGKLNVVEWLKDNKVNLEDI